MISPRPMTILAVCASLLAGGCSTFSDAGQVARVNDAELDEDELDDLLPLVADPETLEPGATGGASRLAISVWLEAQVFTQALADAGIEIDQATLDARAAELETQLPAFAGLNDDTRALITEYVAGVDPDTGRLSELPRPDDDELRDWFDAGPEASGVACVAHVLVETEDEADEIVAELAAADDEGGDTAEQAEFFNIAAARSIDPSAVDNGGFLLCDRVDSISQQFVPEFADGVLAATPGVPTDPVESQFGFHVIRLETFDESSFRLDPFFASGFVQAEFAVSAADIWVASRFGTADGLTVVPLGG